MFIEAICVINNINRILLPAFSYSKIRTWYINICDADYEDAWPGLCKEQAVGCMIR